MTTYFNIALEANLSQEMIDRLEDQIEQLIKCEVAEISGLDIHVTKDEY